MRRIEYQGEEYLIHTRTGWRLKDAMAEVGLAVSCQCGKGAHEACEVKFPKDTLFSLMVPTPRERQVLGEDKLKNGHRLACEALFK